MNDTDADKEMKKLSRELIGYLEEATQAFFSIHKATYRTGILFDAFNTAALNYIMNIVRCNAIYLNKLKDTNISASAFIDSMEYDIKRALMDIREDIKGKKNEV